MPYSNTYIRSKFFTSGVRFGDGRNDTPQPHVHDYMEQCGGSHEHLT